MCPQYACKNTHNKIACPMTGRATQFLRIKSGGLHVKTVLLYRCSEVYAASSAVFRAAFTADACVTLIK